MRILLLSLFYTNIAQFCPLILSLSTVSKWFFPYLDIIRHPTPVLLPGKSHGRRSLEGCSPWGRWRSDMTERLHFHFSLSCAGEGIGNPLQCSCPENPRDGGAWWAAVYRVAQSRTRLKWLSSSSSSTIEIQNSKLSSSERPKALKEMFCLHTFSTTNFEWSLSRSVRNYFKRF